MRYAKEYRFVNGCGRKAQVSVVVAVLVFIVLAIVFLVFGLKLIRRSAVISEEMAAILLQNFERASPLEKAMICSYLRCRYGCANLVGLEEKLQWRDKDGNLMNCSAVPPVCPIDPSYRKDCKLEKGASDCICNEGSVLSAITVQISHSSDGRVSRSLLEGYVKKGSHHKGLCIVSEESDFHSGVFRTPVQKGGELNWISLPSFLFSNIQETTLEECDNGVEAKDAIGSGNLKEGTYYIFTYEGEPPAMGWTPFAWGDFFTTCVVNKDPRNYLSQGMKPEKICEELHKK